MWALRHEARALSRLAQLAQCPPAFTAAASCAHGGLASGSSGSAAWAHATVRHAWGMGKGGEDGGSSSKGGGGITGWLTSKLPAMLGGDKIEDLDIESEWAEAAEGSCCGPSVRKHEAMMQRRMG